MCVCVCVFMCKCVHELSMCFHNWLTACVTITFIKDRRDIVSTMEPLQRPFLAAGNICELVVCCVFISVCMSVCVCVCTGVCLSLSLCVCV